MLDAMESSVKGNDNFATKVISTEHIERNLKKFRRKNQTYFFSMLLTWALVLSYLLWKIITF